MPTPLDPLRYLDRIGYRGSLDAGAGTLGALQRAHIHTVPFENLDISAGRPIALDLPSLHAKIVERRRGGFCYECNGLFAWLLEALGFRVTLLSARVAAGGGAFGPPFDHLALRIDLDEPWLVDVGFGDAFDEPLRLVAGVEQCQATTLGTRTFDLRESDGELLLLRQGAGASWDPQYLLDPTPRRLQEFEAMCLHHQTDPRSPFTRGSLCTRLTEEGRITLRGNRLIRTRGTERVEELLTDDAARAALRDHFGIDPGEAAPVRSPSPRRAEPDG